MALKKVQDCILLSHEAGVLDVEEFCLLYELNKPAYPYFEHTSFERFSLHSIPEAECLSNFRFSLGSRFESARKYQVL